MTSITSGPRTSKKYIGFTAVLCCLRVCRIKVREIPKRKRGNELEVVGVHGVKVRARGGVANHWGSRVIKVFKEGGRLLKCTPPGIEFHGKVERSKILMSGVIDIQA